MPRLVISAKLKLKGKGKASLPKTTTHLVFTEVAPIVNCRVMADREDVRSIRFESGLIVGTIDDDELEAAYKDIDHAIQTCLAKVDRF